MDEKKYRKKLNLILEKKRITNPLRISALPNIRKLHTKNDVIYALKLGREILGQFFYLFRIGWYTKF